jgi:hypothetical protein
VKLAIDGLAVRLQFEGAAPALIQVPDEVV